MHCYEYELLGVGWGAGREVKLIRAMRSYGT